MSHDDELMDAVFLELPNLDLVFQAATSCPLSACCVRHACICVLASLSVQKLRTSSASMDHFPLARHPPETGAVCSDRGSHCEDSAEPSIALRNPVVGLRCLCQRIRLDNRLNFSLRYEIKCFVQIFGAVLLAANYSNAFPDEIH